MGTMWIMNTTGVALVFKFDFVNECFKAPECLTKNLREFSHQTVFLDCLFELEDKH